MNGEPMTDEILQGRPLHHLVVAGDVADNVAIAIEEKETDWQKAILVRLIIAQLRKRAVKAYCHRVFSIVNLRARFSASQNAGSSRADWGNSFPSRPGTIGRINRTTASER